MKKKQIEKLKGFMETFKSSQGDRRIEIKTQMISYLAGCLDGE